MSVSRGFASREGRLSEPGYRAPPKPGRVRVRDARFETLQISGYFGSAARAGRRRTVMGANASGERLEPEISERARPRRRARRLRGVRILPEGAGSREPLAGLFRDQERIVDPHRRRHRQRLSQVGREAVGSPARNIGPRRRCGDARDHDSRSPDHDGRLRLFLECRNGRAGRSCLALDVAGAAARPSRKPLPL